MKISEGDYIKVNIVDTRYYGVLFKYGKQEGLIHVSELSNDFVFSITSILAPGDKAVVKVLKIERNGFIRASLKQVPEDKYSVTKAPIDEIIDTGPDRLLEKLPTWIESALKEMDKYE
ncbi:MAG: S1 RNA-binding domain-containing protein [Coprobacillus sp.]|nr:S1 RNA-binding domain-containing protein [Coprobacillus sp.]